MGLVELEDGLEGTGLACYARSMTAAINPHHDPHRDPHHDPEECYQCLLEQEVISTCRCAACCRSLLIEVGLEDAEREPKIKEHGSPLYTPPELTESGERELEGYLLNGPDLACVFLDQATNLCTVYATRPLACRLFDCDGEGREQLIELGIVNRDANSSVAQPPSNAVGDTCSKNPRAEPPAAS